ncbi:MAG: hypothetical protein LQ340_001187 [Diploschistes diacapsis]|nr:MAG: hypothetical protein LQ340_001187 [Diploschistes diacapsis]
MGYTARTYNAEKTPDWSRTAYILETLGILISPAFMAASMYMLFGRLIRLCDGDQRSFIKAKWLTAIFVTGDVLSLLVQAVGGGEVISTDPDTIRRGEKIIDAGLLVQIASFGTFITSALVFHWRILKHPTDASTNPAHPWQKHLITLYITSCLIFGRCIFRAASYLQGYGGQIAKSEVLFYIFDATFVWIVTVIFNIIHPSEVRALLIGKGRIFWKGRLEQIDFQPYHIDDEIPLHRRDRKARH